jgi:hypothetical protein
MRNQIEVSKSYMNILSEKGKSFRIGREHFEAIQTALNLSNQMQEGALTTIPVSKKEKIKCNY